MIKPTPIKNTHAYDYAKYASRENKKIPKYVQLQAMAWKRIADGKSRKYCIDENKISQIIGLLAIMNMPKGEMRGKPLNEALTGFQWFFLISIFCTVHTDNQQRRKYTKVVLEIARKNGKTMLIAILFIILLMTEPKFTKMFSVAPDGDLSNEVYIAISEIIKCSPLLDRQNIFKVYTKKIECSFNNTKYTPLNYKNGRFDGREAAVFLADEVGALPNNEAIESMNASQVNVFNPLAVIISTKYPKLNNVFDGETDYCKTILDKVNKDEELFALLYEPDNSKGWETDDNIIYQANPLAIDRLETKAFLFKQRRKAIIKPSARENFLCKHCNIQYSGNEETFIDLADLVSGRQNKINFGGKDVYVGVDLSLTTDNTAVVISYLDENIIKSYAMVFVPEGQIEAKNKAERINYNDLAIQGVVTPCGNKTIDYTVIEDFIMNIESNFHCNIKSIGFDPYQAQSTMNKLEKEGYNVVRISQNAATLHPTIQYFRDKIINHEFQYQNNKLLEINFQNCKVCYDGGARMYFSKKKQRGRIDIVAALIDSVYLIYQDFLNDDDFIIYDIN